MLPSLEFLACNPPPQVSGEGIDRPLSFSSGTASLLPDDRKLAVCSSHASPAPSGTKGECHITSR